MKLLMNLSAGTRHQYPNPKRSNPNPKPVCVSGSGLFRGFDSSSPFLTCSISVADTAAYHCRFAPFLSLRDVNSTKVVHPKPRSYIEHP